MMTVMMMTMVMMVVVMMILVVVMIMVIMMMMMMVVTEKEFENIGFFLTLSADRQTDRRTETGLCIHRRVTLSEVVRERAGIMYDPEGDVSPIHRSCRGSARAKIDWLA